ncbi:MAG: DoxX family protein [Candidatus Acidiferrales bacterium]
MSSAPQAATTSKTMLWAGYIISAIPVLFLILNGVMSVIKPEMVKQGVAHLGYPESAAPSISIAMVACALVYAIPRTSILGAILLTGYLGGATASHVRIGEPFYFPIIFGVLVWLGLFLRDERLRAIVPIRK